MTHRFMFLFHSERTCALSRGRVARSFLPSTFKVPSHMNVIRASPYRSTRSRQRPRRGAHDIAVDTVVRPLLQCRNRPELVAAAGEEPALRTTSSCLALTSFVTIYPGVRARHVGRRQLMTRLQPSSAAGGISPLPLGSMVAVNRGLALTGTRGSGWRDWPTAWGTSVAAVSRLTRAQCFMGAR
jgi:hypothetical protein